MTAAEEGVLLLCCRLGDLNCKPLTMPQFRELGHRVRAGLTGKDPLRQLQVADLTALGYEETQADEILRLLDRDDRLLAYLHQAEDLNIHPITRLSVGYPQSFSQTLGLSAPPVLFYRGDLTLLSTPSVSVVGSRRLLPKNEAFARESGQYLSRTGRTLVSGGAIGADRIAQEACLSNGGSTVIFPADRLMDHRPEERTLYLCTDGFDIPFSVPRALSRNKLIHIQGQKTLAVQCACGVGGTWQGCMENLKCHWSKLYVFADGSQGTVALAAQGAIPIAHPSKLDD